MISLKIRRARKECLSYDQLRDHFYGIPERHIRVSPSLWVDNGSRYCVCLRKVLCVC